MVGTLTREEHTKKHWAAVVMAAAFGLTLPLLAQESSFHHAPKVAAAVKNPYVGKPRSAAAGEKIYRNKCSNSRGDSGAGTGAVPSLARGRTQKATAGELFWFITHGESDNGMPSWVSFSREQRWQVVDYLQSLGISRKSQDASVKP